MLLRSVNSVRFASLCCALGLLVCAAAPAAGRVKARIDGTTFELQIPDRPPRGFKPGKLAQDLKALIKAIEAHFGRKLVITSGCRTLEHNRAVGGAPRSYHLSCDAVDFVIPGVAKETIRDFALSIPGRGGVGSYCHLEIVHVDVGPRRQWHWPCGGPRHPFDLDAPARAKLHTEE